MAAEGLNAPAGNTSPCALARRGIRRSPQAVAGRKRDVKALGKPQQRLPGREVEKNSPPSADGVASHAESSEVGKAHYQGKDGTEGRSPPRKLLPDIVGSDHHQPPSLRGIANTARVNKQPRFRDLYRCLDAARLLACWQDLNKAAASGGANVTAAYGAHRHAHIAAWGQRLKAHRYRAKVVRRCSMPQENGTERPRGIPALEDKLVQRACAKLRSASYEQDFLECRSGSRSGRGALEAVRDRTFDRQYETDGDGGEGDVTGFCDHLDHTWVEDRLRVRIDARALRKLMRKWLKAGSLATDGPGSHPESGTPQGGTGSPVLANAYLHYALDVWCEKVGKTHGRGEARLCRDAADWGGACR